MLPCEFIEFPDQIMILLQLFCEIIHRINVIISTFSSKVLQTYIQHDFGV